MGRRLAGIFLLALTFGGSLYAGSGRINRAEHRVPNQYIVVFEKNASPAAMAATASLVAQTGGRVLLSYDVLFTGLAIHTTDAVAQAISAQPHVAFVEENAIAFPATYRAQTISILGPTTASLWGLDRIDQPTPSSARLNSLFEYCTTGAGVRAYVVDTGVFPRHKEFEGRVDTTAGNALTQYLSDADIELGPQCWETSSPDAFSAAASHGTAVASLIGGRTYGVAKGVTLIDARALNCGGSAPVSVINKVLEWIPQDPNRYAGDGSMSGRVVNLSFTLSKYDDPGSSINASVQSLTLAHNIKVVVAAGNFGENAQWYTPANSPYAIVAAGLAKASDSRWSYSNYGYTTDIYAPAQYVESASTEVTELIPYATSDMPRSGLSDCTDRYPQDTCTSGTSFAAPLTAGVVARYLQTYRMATRDEVVNFLHAEAAAHNGITIFVGGSADAPVLSLRDCP